MVILEPDLVLATIEFCCGTTILVPVSSRAGFRMLGLAASSSSHREPRPKVRCASFQRESPRCTVTICDGKEGWAIAGSGTTVDGPMFGCAAGETGTIGAGTTFGSAATGANLRKPMFVAAILGETFGCRSSGVGTERETWGWATGAVGAI